VFREKAGEFQKGVSFIEISAPKSEQRLLWFGRLNLPSRNFVEPPGVTASIADGVEFGKIGEFFARNELHASGEQQPVSEAEGMLVF
jgi:hypothetical protein